MKGILEKMLGVSKVDRWTYYDSEGFVFGHPSVVEVDVAIKGSEHILVELKSSASDSDALKLLRIGELYRRVVGVKPRLVLIAVSMRKKHVELAKSMGVEVYAGEELLFE